MRPVNASIRRSSEPVIIQELGLIDYREAWNLQREIANARADDLGPDHLLLLEHPSVYTAGRRTEAIDRPMDGTEVIDVDRGGKITWHGPGQLVGYPIVKLGEPLDVVNFVRRLEQALIDVCAQFGLTTQRVEGRSGVWLPAAGWKPERKIAAIGVRVARGVTLHGFAINANPALTAFNSIVPCGIRDVGVTSLSEELGREVTVAEVLPLAKRATLAALDGQLVVA